MRWPPLSKELEGVREGAMQVSVHGPDTERVWNVRPVLWLEQSEKGMMGNGRWGHLEGPGLSLGLGFFFLFFPLSDIGSHWKVVSIRLTWWDLSGDSDGHAENRPCLVTLVGAQTPVLPFSRNSFNPTVPQFPRPQVRVHSPCFIGLVWEHNEILRVQSTEQYLAHSTSSPIC